MSWLLTCLSTVLCIFTFRGCNKHANHHFDRSRSRCYLISELQSQHLAIPLFLSFLMKSPIASYSHSCWKLFFFLCDVNEINWFISIDELHASRHFGISQWSLICQVGARSPQHCWQLIVLHLDQDLQTKVLFDKIVFKDYETMLLICFNLFELKCILENTFTTFPRKFWINFCKMHWNLARVG